MATLLLLLTLNCGVRSVTPMQFTEGCDGTTHVAADMIELNHVVNPKRRSDLHQYIFWEWIPQYKGWGAMNYSLVRDGGRIKKVGDRYIFYWQDSKGRMNTIHSKIFIETWTSDDPEACSKRFLPPEERVTIGVPRG